MVGNPSPVGRKSASSPASPPAHIIFETTAVEASHDRNTLTRQVTPMEPGIWRPAPSKYVDGFTAGVTSRQSNSVEAGSWSRSTHPVSIAYVPGQREDGPYRPVA